MTPVLDHLGRQVASSERLLGIVLAQRDAIRRHDVEGVLARLTEIQAEMAARQRLEEERDAIIRSAAAHLGLPTDLVELDHILSFLPAADAARGRELSAELRGLLTEVGRVHETNRVLIRQELAFVDHLMRALSGTPQGAYGHTGTAPVVLAASSSLDARA